MRSSKLSTQYRTRLLLSIVVVAASLGAGVYAAHGLAGSASGTVINKQTARTPTPRSAIRYYTLDGDYLSLQYPDSFTVIPDQNSGGAALQRHVLHRSSGGSLTLTVTVSSLPSGQLDDDPSYHLRTLYPQTYQLAPQTIHGDHLVVASRLDSFENVAFWPHAGKLATIALSGSTTHAAADEATYRAILQSVAWP